MNEFEFLAVFISIVVGLGVTHVLYGLARVINGRMQQRVAMLHLVWTANVLLILLLNWWTLFLWVDYGAWSFDIYLLLISWGIALYMLTIPLYPPDMQSGDAYQDIFDRNRGWLLGTFVIFVALDIVQTAVRGQLFEPRTFLPYVLHLAVLAIVGMLVANRRYQVFLAWYMLIVLVLWSVIVRRVLGA